MFGLCIDLKIVKFHKLIVSHKITANGQGLASVAIFRDRSARTEDE